MDQRDMDQRDFERKYSRYYSHHCHHHHHHDYNNGFRKLAFGIIIIGVGLVFLFDNLGILPHGAKSILISWQMLLIAIGVINLSSRSGSIVGAILILIGVFFLLPELFFFPFPFGRLFWPFLLISLGLIIILKHRYSRPVSRPQNMQAGETADIKDDYLDDVAVFGGGKRMIYSTNFKGGKITAIFGGSEIDLTHSQLAEGKNVIDLTAIFGGATIIVPNNWHVRVEMASILGGFADNRFINPDAFSANKDRELIIKGVAIFGGGEIKSY